MSEVSRLHETTLTLWSIQPVRFCVWDPTISCHNSRRDLVSYVHLQPLQDMKECQSVGRRVSS